MFECDDEGNWNAMHHPFTAPLASDLPKLKENPANALLPSLQKSFRL
jgi:aspartyl-tRNA synthetase